jgi:hypothetical protein
LNRRQFVAKIRAESWGGHGESGVTHHIEIVVPGWKTDPYMTTPEELAQLEQDVISLNKLLNGFQA